MTDIRWTPYLKNWVLANNQSHLRLSDAEILAAIDAGLTSAQGALVCEGLRRNKRRRPPTLKDMLGAVADAYMEENRIRISNNGAFIELPLLHVLERGHSEENGKKEAVFTFFMPRSEVWYNADFIFDQTFSIYNFERIEYANCSMDFNTWYCGKITECEHLEFVWRFRLVEATIIHSKGIRHEFGCA